MTNPPLSGTFRSSQAAARDFPAGMPAGPHAWPSAGGPQSCCPPGPGRQQKPQRNLELGVTTPAPSGLWVPSPRPTACAPHSDITCLCACTQWPLGHPRPPSGGQKSLTPRKSAGSSEPLSFRALGAHQKESASSRPSHQRLLPGLTQAAPLAKHSLEPRDHKGKLAKKREVHRARSRNGEAR